jgi:hypothetical protein
MAASNLPDFWPLLEVAGKVNNFCFRRNYGLDNLATDKIK